jgi:hypothetical protein
VNSGGSAEINIESSEANANVNGLLSYATTGGTTVMRVSQTTIMNNSSEGIYVGHDTGPDGSGIASVISFGNNRVAANAGATTFTSTVPLQ